MASRALRNVEVAIILPSTNTSPYVDPGQFGSVGSGNHNPNHITGSDQTHFRSKFSAGGWAVTHKVLGYTYPNRYELN